MKNNDFKGRVNPLVRCGNCYWFRPTGNLVLAKYREGICGNQTNPNDLEDVEYVTECERCQNFVSPNSAWWETPEGKKHLEREINSPN